MYRIFLLLILIIPVSGSAQDQIFGSWQGKMSGAKGNYIFNLDILPNYKEGGSAIRGVAVHDRNGDKSVIELSGVIYGDQSIYLADVADPSHKILEGATFSKLQFLFKYQNGDIVLDGHWQEYRDLHKYRKGRLVLKKLNSKAYELVVCQNISEPLSVNKHLLSYIIYSSITMSIAAIL
jgi:hypothetical protein